MKRKRLKRSSLKLIIFYCYLYCSHIFLAVSSSDSETTQVRKSVIHAKYFHLPMKVLTSHKGLSRSNLSFVIMLGKEVLSIEDLIKIIMERKQDNYNGEFCKSFLKIRKLKFLFIDRSIINGENCVKSSMR